MTYPDFDLRALWQALDERRSVRGMTWAAVAREMKGVAASTMTGLADHVVAEGDGVLQMLLWLGRTPESFVPGFPESGTEAFQLQPVPEGMVLRWDPAALHAGLHHRRSARAMAWTAVAEEIGGCTPAMLTRLAKGGRVGFPGVMRMVRWLDRPAASFTRAVPRGPRTRRD